MRAAPSASVFNNLDWTVVAIFIVVMFAITLYAMRTKAQSGKDYFLSGRDSSGLLHRVLVIKRTWADRDAWLRGRWRKTA
jgi:Na+/proline symporter